MVHVVQAGDTLFAISRRYNLTTARLLELNGLKPYDTLRPGQQLVVSEEQRRPMPTSQEVFHTVQPGDTLFNISRRYQITPEAILQLNGMSASQTIFVGQQLRVSQSAPAAVPQPAPVVAAPPPIQAPPPPAQGASSQFYTVQRGDSLFAIAQRFGTTPERLLRLNNLQSNAILSVGQQLIVAEPTIQPVARQAEPAPQPVITGQVYTVQRGDSLFAIAQRFGTTPQQLLQLNGLAPDATIFVGQVLQVSAPRQTMPANNPTLRTHTVQRGDTLSQIAARYQVVPEEIVRLNALTSPLFVGQQLLIPMPQSSQPSPAPAPTPVSPAPPTIIPPAGGVTVPPHLMQRYQEVVRARSIFQLETVDGTILMGNGLQRPVGRTANILPADLEKVQARLIQLGLLVPNHGESPAQLLSRLGNTPIAEGSIPRTIAAIEQFQNRFRVDFWIQTEARAQMVGTREFTRGVVAPNDVTYKVLRDFARYRLTVPHPEAPGQSIVSEFTNFVRSGHTVFYQGVGFVGNFMPDIPFEVFASFGIDQNMALALKYISSHEGNFDAINTYDKAHFSWGFIQFAGKGGGTNGPLGAVIATMKTRQPQLFAAFFQKIGIDVDVIMRGNQIHDGNLKIFDIHAINGRFETEGEDAERALRADKQLYGAFIRAAYHPEFCKAQIERAVIGYVRPALTIRTDINTGRLQLSGVPLNHIISSAMGCGLIVDLTVNQWINRTRDVFRSAIERVAALQSLHTPAQLQMIDERQVLRQIVQDATDDRIRKRAGSILNSSLSPQKSVSVPPLA
jgi:peptidoglycan endopeptidase LytF